jgi:hypothetical protein
MKPEMKSAARGTKLVIEKGAPLRGEPASLNHNKAAPKSMGGGPRDLSRTLKGSGVPAPISRGD